MRRWGSPALFAATYPERTRALILANSFARATAADGYPWAQSLEEWQQTAESIPEFWGTGLLLDVFAPSALHDPCVLEWWPRFQRQAVSPSGIRTLLLMNSEIDSPRSGERRRPDPCRASKGDRLCPIGAGRYMAERVPEAQFVELPGDDHYIWFGGDADRFADEVERFLTGTFNPREPDRALVTILFVDIADSTAKAAQLGDRIWRDLVDSFYAVVRNELERTRGRLIDTAGDGVFAAFDGPARAIQAGLGIAERVQRFGLTVRAGVHIGEAEIVGDGLRGITVHIGSRVASKARESEVLVLEHREGSRRRVGFQVRRSGLPRAKGGHRPLAALLGPGLTTPSCPLPNISTSPGGQGGCSRCPQMVSPAISQTSSTSLSK